MTRRRSAHTDHDAAPATEHATGGDPEPDPPAARRRADGSPDRPDARQIIDRAKAAVMSRQAITEQQAFRWLQRAAIDHRTSIRAVADWVIRHQAPVTPRHPTGRTLVRRSRATTLRSIAPGGIG
jgi:hypothetical protein